LKLKDLLSRRHVMSAISVLIPQRTRQPSDKRGRIFGAVKAAVANLYRSIDWCSAVSWQVRVALSLAIKNNNFCKGAKPT
jgi:hypothetical protein